MKIDRYLLAKLSYLDRDLKYKANLFKRQKSIPNCLLRVDERSWPIGDGLFVVAVSFLRLKQ